MSENTFRSSPYMTPDSLRQKLHLDKSFYDLHTKKYYGREDINGLQYAGTVENFGSEMLLESRKIRMLKPPLTDIVKNSYMDHYFELKYADEINTYNQMNMVVAVLKKDVLLSNNLNVIDREARIIFHNVKRKRILRSRFDSDENVVNRIYYETKTPPVLKYDNGNTIDEYPLIAHDQSGEDTTYYFAVTINSLSTLDGLFGRDFTDEEYERAFIDPDLYDYQHGDLVTIPLTQDMEELPFIWMTFPSYNTLPELVMENNVDRSGRPLLEVGTNGHHQSFLYPYAYGEDNHPAVAVSDMYESRGWSLRVYAKDNMFVENDDPKNNPNHNVAIRKIQFIYGPKLNYNADFANAFHAVNTAQPVVVHEITIPDNEFLRITLVDFTQYDWNKNVQTGKDRLIWHFRHAQPQEWDYDGTLFRNPTYAFVYGIDEFFANNFHVGLFQENDPSVAGRIKSMYPLFKILFNEDYFDAFDGITENAVSGIHVDYTTDYSDHCVDKKNGTIYDLGDFDGLPSYYTTYQNRTVHRSHVELYSIRDDINNRNQTATERQVAALLVDAAIPQTEARSLQLDLNPVIQFDHSRRYHTTDVSVSAYNSLTDIAWLGGGRKFGDVQLPKYQNETKKLIYHGSRYYSLSMTGLDPSEIARVYSVTNDPGYYENNETTSCPKPARTLARICDIPTEYGQLVHIDGISPTFVADPYYIHSECDYTIDDQDRIWNLNRDDHFVYGLIQGGRTYIFGAGTNLDAALSDTYLNYAYIRMSNLNRFMDMTRACKTSHQKNDYTSTKYRWIIVNEGENYRNGSQFMILIGGIATIGDVVSNQPGYITGPAEDYVNSFDEKRTIHIANLSYRDQEYNTTTTRYSGTGLTIRIDIDDDMWESLQPRRDTLLSNLYTFKKDDEGNIWAWYYRNGHWEKDVQITGTLLYENQYDDDETRDSRKIIPAMLHNFFRIRQINRKLTNTLSYHYAEEMVSIYNAPSNTNIDAETTDLSQSISEAGANYQDAYYTLTKYPMTISVNVYQPIATGGDPSILMFHKNHKFTEYEHYPRTNELVISMEGLLISEDKQPILAYYNPYIKTVVEVSTIGPDIVKYEYEHDLTFMDLDERLVDFDNVTGTLHKAVYKYDGFRIPYEQEILGSLLASNDVTTLLNHIHRMYGDDCEPMWYRDTEFAYTAPMLKNYIVENLRREPSYSPNVTNVTSPISKLRNTGDHVVDKTGDRYTAIGEQPTGAYIQIGTSIFHSDMTASDGTYLTSRIAYIFRIDQEIEDLNGFRMIDDMNSIDVSGYTLLIYMKEFYIFNETSNTWQKIIRAS